MKQELESVAFIETVKFGHSYTDSGSTIQRKTCEALFVEGPLVHIVTNGKTVLVPLGNVRQMTAAAPVEAKPQTQVKR